MKSEKNFRLVIVGLGSIGRQHLRNLVALGQHDIILCRSGNSTLPDRELHGFKTVASLPEALEHRPHAVIVSNPTALHMHSALTAARSNCHLFLEKPISHKSEGAAALLYETEKRGLRVQTGFQFRFHPAFKQIKTWLEDHEIGAIVSLHAHWGEYLPDWHPWEDYRKSYSAQAKLGGGVILTLCHPFDYLRWLSGEVETVFAIAQRKSGLGLEVEDTAHVILRFANAIGNVCLDYVERPPRHALTVIGQKGKIIWEYDKGAAHHYQAETRTWTSIEPQPEFERNQMFLTEMQHFLDCLQSGALPQPNLIDGIRALELALTARQSALKRRELDVIKLV